MKFLVLFVLILFPFCAEAKKKPAAKAERKDASTMTEAELRAMAESELRVEKPGDAIVPLRSPNSGMVSTDEILKRDLDEPFPASEFELGIQSYSPKGTGTISSGETYSYAGLRSRPLASAGFRHWFYQNLRSSRPWRVGGILQLSLSSNSLDVETSRGVNYQNVHLNTYLAKVGPEAEYFIDSRRHWAAGLGLGFSRIFAVQSGGSSSLNRSQDANAWEAGAHIRFQPFSGFFARLGYSRRGIVGESEGLGTQENNYGAFIGFGM